MYLLNLYNYPLLFIRLFGYFIGVWLLNVVVNFDIFANGISVQMNFIIMIAYLNQGSRTITELICQEI